VKRSKVNKLNHNAVLASLTRQGRGAHLTISDIRRVSGLTQADALVKQLIKRGLVSTSRWTFTSSPRPHGSNHRSRRAVTS
jgi:hypothetical protein